MPTIFWPWCLGLADPPGRLVGQRVDTSKAPHEVFLEVTADRGAEYSCRVCGVLCKAHDFQEFTWRHINLFQHHCYVTARLPRMDCPEHGIKGSRPLGLGKAAASICFSSRPP